MAAEATPKRGRKSTKNNVRASKQTPSGYVVEEFDTPSGGYGNLRGEEFTPLQSIRRFCWNCQGGHEFDWRNGDGTVDKKYRPLEEVKSCPSTTCYLYPYRTGRTKTRQRQEATPAQLASLERARAAKKLF